jgi:hypothetical protein
MLGVSRKSLLFLEAVVCFGPLTVVLFFGVLIFPVWTAMLMAYALGSFDPVQDGPLPMPWVVIWPMTLVACGLLGLLGLARTLWILSAGVQVPKWRVGTLVMLGVGMLAVVALNLYDADNPLDDPIEFLALFGLPVMGALHLAYLARHQLFPPRGVAASGASHNNALERTRRG